MGDDRSEWRPVSSGRLHFFSEPENGHTFGASLYKRCSDDVVSGAAGWGPFFPCRPQERARINANFGHVATQNKRVAKRFPKELATWQWARYCHDECLREGKHPLLINIDESPMPLVYANAMGHIVRGLGPHADRCKEPRRAASRHEQRVHYTFVAMICNNTEIQKLLPQVIIVPERVLPIAAWRAIDNELPENVYLVRQPSMWVTATLYAPRPYSGPSKE